MQPSVFVATIDLKLVNKLTSDLASQGFEFTNPPYTHFAAKKAGVSCTLYTSGKLTVQGKNMKEFIEFYLEPEILQSFKFTNPLVDVEVDLTPRIGIDESGKGDFFGPLCTAGVYADSNQVKKLVSLGVCDSKTLTEKKILDLAPKIQKICAHQIIRVNPLKYNELYHNFKNLNKLLAWTHAAAIEQLVLRTHCNTVIIDQFAAEFVVLAALRKKELEVSLTQRHKAEQDVVVASASILARYAFITGLENLSKSYEIELPKGASSLVVKKGKEFVHRHGQNALPNVAKMHFKTLDMILQGN